MAIIEITPSLEKEIDKVFKKRSIQVFKHLKALENNPKKGKPLGRVGAVAIKELKFEGYRFYFITDAVEVRFLPLSELTELLLRFVRMSDKKQQHKVIAEIRHVLLSIGPRGFA